MVSGGDARWSWPKCGYAVVLAARSVKEGTAIEHSSTIKRSDTVPLPGSLETTAREVEELGGEALSVKLDLFERADCDNLIDTTLEKYGRIDVLINNARYIGPGHMDHFVDTPIEALENHFLANVINPAVPDPARPRSDDQAGRRDHDQRHLRRRQPRIGQGHRRRRLGPRLLDLEGVGEPHGRRASARSSASTTWPLSASNPASSVTERMTQDMGAFGFDIPGLSTDVPGAVVAYMCEHPYPMVFAGKTINGPQFAPEHNLVDGRGFPDPYGPGTWGLPTAPIL